MKRILITSLALALCVFVLFGIMPGEAKAANEVITCDIGAGFIPSSVKFTLYDDGTMIFKGTGKMAMRPADAKMQEYFEAAKTVVIESGVTSIGGGIFRDCPNLTSVTIADTVTEIDGYAFANCTKLTSITIPDSITTIGMNAFSGSGLTSVTIPGSVQEFGMSVLSGCTGLESVTLEKGCTSVGWQMFMGCTKLSAVNLPDTLKTIEAYAFSGCTGLKKITIPKSVTDIGMYAFENCTALGSITLPEIATISMGTFSGCTSLKKITIPASVTSIGAYAFANCTGLSTITFEGDMPLIDMSAFQNVKATAYYPKNSTYTNTGYGGTITWKETADAVTAPSVTASNVASTGKIKLSWEKVDGATEYHVYRATSEFGSYEDIKTVSATSHTDQTAEAGKNYYYKVRAVNKDGIMSNYSSAASAACKLAQPKVEESNVTASGAIKLEWQQIENARMYMIYRREGKSGAYTYHTATADTSYTDSDTKAGTVYYYQVMAVHENLSANSERSEDVGQTCKLPQPKVEESNVSSSGKIKLEWSKIEGATKYKIYRRVGKTGSYAYYQSTEKNTYTDKKTEAGKVYYYKVVAVHENTSANSAKSSGVGQTCKLARPEVEESNVKSSGAIKLEWKKIEGAIKYKIYRRVGKTGDYEYYKSTTKTSYTDKDTKAGTVYYYKVKAVHEKSSADSAKSSGVGQTCDLARPNVKVKLSKGDPKLSWEKISDATEYKIYRATSKDGKYKLVKETTSLKFTDKKAKEGKTYYYKVKAIHKTSSANSAYSSVDKIKAK